MTNLVFVFARFVVSAVAGLTGVGAGSLMAPLLMIACGLRPQTALQSLARQRFRLRFAP